MERDAHELARDPEFAGAVLGHSVGRDWRIAIDGESYDDREDLEWRLRGSPEPSFETSAEVFIAATDFARRSWYAQRANASLLPEGRAENSIIDRALRSAGEVVPLRTASLLRGTGILHLRGLKPADVLAIRAEVQAYNQWREWLQHITTSSHAEAAAGFSSEQDRFDEAVAEEMAAALKDATRLASLRRYARREGGLTATKITAKVALGTVPASEAGQAAFKIAKALFRPRAEGHRAILVRLSER